MVVCGHGPERHVGQVSHILCLATTGRNPEPQKMARHFQYTDTELNKCPEYDAIRWVTDKGRTLTLETVF